MIDITFEINGRKVDPNRIGDALERALFMGLGLADRVGPAVVEDDEPLCQVPSNGQL